MPLPEVRSGRMLPLPRTLHGHDRAIEAELLVERRDAIATSTKHPGHFRIAAHAGADESGADAAAPMLRGNDDHRNVAVMRRQGQSLSCVLLGGKPNRVR